MSYLGNGYYRLANRDSGKALEVAGGASSTQDGTNIDQANWEHSPNQQWRFVPAGDGWVRIEARQSGKAVDITNCATDGAKVQQGSPIDNACQQFRLQPVAAVKIMNANSDKLVAVDQASTADGASVVLASDTAAGDARWSFVHQDNGYYQLKASQSGKCLEVAGQAGVAGAPVDQHTCAGNPNQQWRIEPLDDGTVRLVARPAGDVLDVVNCRMADGTHLQQWTWLNNPCQRFRFIAP